MWWCSTSALTPCARRATATSSAMTEEDWNLLGPDERELLKVVIDDR